MALPKVTKKTDAPAVLATVKNKSKRVIRLGDLVLLPEEPVEIMDEDILALCDELETITVKRTTKAGAQE